MGLCKISSSLAVGLMGLALAYISYAQNSPQDFLDAHNAARAEVGVESMTWDNTVATYPEKYASLRILDCNLAHSGGLYGENIAWPVTSLTGTDAVNLWVGEKPNYDYNSNSCVRGTCGHYTQVIWRNSLRLGCARAQCNNGGWFVSCNYDPPGNYMGQRPFPENSNSSHSCIVAIY
ncbi:hypothetical protein PVL29_003436 [Vitis rotundifolia]|uniref:SCP domain-containing protein n=1 Tax=Vitis rotundifolia TaxID=103349 RepID=A0AA39E343_VITRO|nr:hypothetical protein PVL29_003436 [Vitis rotundifolia]